jgi:electron transfer flavoprotein alpha subunit
MRRCAIFIEQRNQKICSIGLELLSEVKRQLKEDAVITAILLTDHETDQQITDMTSCGADEIIIVHSPKFKDYDTHYYSQMLSKVIVKEAFDVVLLGSTLIGRDLAPRISARLHTGLTADATLLEFNKTDEKLELLATRPALGGNLFATIICPLTLPQMATVRPGVFPVEVNMNRTSSVSYIDFDVDSLSKVKILEKKSLDTEYKDLTKAKLIIAGGRGVSSMFSILKDIAKLTGGDLAASRAVVDALIEPKDRLVGQTGTTVRPSVYLASGISGAVQHVSGMDKSELIIAINTDPNALIFDIADVSIICDAKKVLPLLKQEIESILHYQS